MIEFNAETHTYTMDKVKLPSVTQIMAPITHPLYSKVNEYVLNKAARRGTEIHKWVELYDKEKQESFNPRVQAYIKWCKDTKQEPIENELRLYHKTLLYAGTLDKLCEINGEIVLVDVKTTSQLHEDIVAVQCSAYREMLLSHGRRVDKIAALQLNKDGTYVYKELKDKFDIFLALYKIYSFNQKGH